MQDNTTRAADRLVTPWLVLVLLGALTLGRLWVNAWLDPLPLSGDEAQYWLYGEHLAGGYYSKPPLLPWLMRLATEVFGPSHWAMRLPSVLIHPLIALTLFAIGAALFCRATGLLAAFLYLTLPAVSVSSMLASTDPPMMLGWALASLALIHALRTGNRAAWILTGAAVGLGALGKYTVLAWIGGAALLLLLDPHWRRGVSASGVALAVAAALVVLSPNLVWNAANGFPTLLHITENADLAAPATPVPLGARAGELADFAAGQLGVFGPIAVLVLLWLMVSPTTWREPAYRFVLVIGLPLVLAILLQAWLNRANANWAAPAYLGFSVAVAAWLVRAARRRLALATIALNLTAAIAIPAVAALHVPEPSAWSRSLDPFRKLRGVDQITDAVGPALAAHPDAWLLMTDRMLMANVLEATGWPLERAVIWNPDGRANNHFELVTRFPDAAVDARFVVVHRGSPQALRQRFAGWSVIATPQARTHSDQVVGFGLYLAEGFAGYAGSAAGNSASVRPNSR